MKIYSEHPVTVLQNPIEDLVERGDYDWVNGLINSTLFPSPKKGCSFEETKIILISFDRVMTSEGVLFEMRYSDISARPADILELLSLSIGYPLLQTQNSIVALGSVGNTEEGGVVPILRRCEMPGRRELSLLSYDRDWQSHNKFAFVDSRK